jgi:hypothetical protein
VKGDPKWYAEIAETKARRINRVAIGSRFAKPVLMRKWRRIRRKKMAKASVTFEGKRIQGIDDARTLTKNQKLLLSHPISQVEKDLLDDYGPIVFFRELTTQGYAEITTGMGHGFIYYVHPESLTIITRGSEFL